MEAIGDRLSTSDAGVIEQHAASLRNSRRSLDAQLEELQAELLRAHTDEYREVVVAGKSYLPSQAARIVAAGRGVHDWIPGPVQLGEPLPLSCEELESLYATNDRCSSEDDLHLDKTLPPIHEIPSPTDLQETLSALWAYQKKGRRSSRLWERATLIAKHIKRDLDPNPPLPNCGVARRRNGRIRVGCCRRSPRRQESLQVMEAVVDEHRRRNVAHGVVKSGLGSIRTQATGR